MMGALYYSASRPIRQVLIAFTLAGINLTPTVLPAPLAPGAAPCAGPSDSPASQGCGAMPMGLRSADAHFIVMMIPHHEGAIAMADLAVQRSRRVQILALAERIRTNQSREILQMRLWYRQWYGVEVPTWHGPGWGMGGAVGMGMGGGMGWGMPGFGTSLEAVRSSPDFDRTFLEQMIAHHRMGVMMASHAEWTSQHPQLRQLEAGMVRMQSEEIEQMSRWYRQWYGGRSK